MTETPMKKSGILNPELAKQLAMLGHFDKICIADAGLPIPAEVLRIDLALTKNVPLLAQVLDALELEIQVQEVIVAKETETKNTSLAAMVKKLWPAAKQSRITHEKFKEQLKDCRVVIRTGEFTPYANVILVSGVPF